MSDEKKTEGEATRKKGGKLPIIVMLAAVLGAGGFFGMKMRAPAEVKKPEIKLGAIVPLEEFLVNLNDGATYLRTAISLHMKEGYELGAGGHGGGEGKGGGEMDIIRDAVIGVLTSQSPESVRSLNGKKKLRAELAAAINKQLESVAHQEESEGGHKEESKDQKKDQAPAHPDWDSQTGPVLKVYFTSFATQ